MPHPEENEPYIMDDELSQFNEQEAEDGLEDGQDIGESDLDED